MKRGNSGPPSEPENQCGNNEHDKGRHKSFRAFPIVAPKVARLSDLFWISMKACPEEVRDQKPNPATSQNPYSTTSSIFATIVSLWLYFQSKLASFAETNLS
jgi:hypothetical protein